MPSPVSISVIGGGSWGTALAHLLGSKGIAVTIWAREEEVVRGINEAGRNVLFLPDVRLPETIRATSDVDEAIADGSAILCAVPTQHIRPVFKKISPSLPGKPLIVSVSKGIERKTLLTATGVLRDVLGKNARLAALSGPSFAAEVAKGKPTAVTLAADADRDAIFLQKVFLTPYFRVYTANDPLGVEIGGALKNVIAIAAGISDGLGLGLSARAAMITRGLAEMIRLGSCLGADPRTFSGLSGLGDLVLTCTGELSRNRTVGYRLGAGETLQEILGSMRMVAEGVETARSAHALAQRAGVEMPIVEEIYKVLYRRKAPLAAVKNLMARSPRPEVEPLRCGRGKRR